MQRHDVMKVLTDPLAQALDAVLRSAGQSASLCPPSWPLIPRDQIRLGLCVSTAAVYPDVTCA
jgi:hypothetical protein